MAGAFGCLEVLRCDLSQGSLRRPLLIVMTTIISIDLSREHKTIQKLN